MRLQFIFKLITCNGAFHQFKQLLHNQIVILLSMETSSRIYFTVFSSFIEISICDKLLFALKKYILLKLIVGSLEINSL